MIRELLGKNLFITLIVLLWQYNFLAFKFIITLQPNAGKSFKVRV